MNVLGVDPGMSGAVSLRGRDFVIVEVMPTLDGELDLASLARWLRAHADEIQIAYLEQGGMRPGQSTQTTHRAGRNFGAMEGILAGVGIAYEVVNPRTWSAEFETGVDLPSKTKKEKDLRYRAVKAARKKIATRLFPGVDLRESARCKTPHEGIVDALLIAEWGYRKLKGRS